MPPAPKAQQHELIATYLRKEISSARLAPGDALPSEAELTRQFATSRGPVRQAMATLRSEGLISSGRGRRSVVLESVPAQPFDVLWSFTQWCQESGVTPGQRTQWVMRQPADAHTAAALDIDDGDPVVRVLRVRTIDGEPVMLERLVYPLEFGRHVLAFDTDAGSIYQHLTDSGVDIHHATRTIDAAAATGEDADLLGIAEGAPLLRIHRRAFTREGRPIEASVDSYRPERVTFSLTTVRGTAAPLSFIPHDSAGDNAAHPSA